MQLPTPMKLDTTPPRVRRADLEDTLPNLESMPKLEDKNILPNLESLPKLEDEQPHQ